MKKRILIVLLILTSLLGYLEWGGDNSSFLFEVELELLVSLFNNPGSVAHPFTIIPLLGQLLLLLNLFKKNPGKKMIYLAIGCLGLLLGFMLFIGLLSWNLKIVLYTLPFIITSIITVVVLRRS